MCYLRVMNKETDPKRYCAYCNYHKEYMTVKQMKFKQCLFKEHINNTCPHLVKIMDHGYWIEKEAKKRLKDNKKF